MKKELKKYNGITIISLTIMIVTLLIISVIIINVVQGDELIKHASNATETYSNVITQKNVLITNIISGMSEYASQATYWNTNEY